jgi:transitional endoplasmic reticulum ATPase
MPIRRPRRRRPRFLSDAIPSVADVDLTPSLARLWALRALREALRRPSGDPRAQENHILEVLGQLGLTRPGADDDDEGPAQRNPRAYQSALVTEDLKRLEAAGVPPGDATVDNARRLGALVGLNEVETTVVALVASAHANGPFQNALSVAVSDVGEARGRLFEIFAAIIGTDSTAIAAAVRPDALLRRAGLLKSDWDSPRHGGVGLMLDEDIVSLLCEPECSEKTMLERLAPVAAPPSLALDDFAHLGGDTSVLLDVMRRATTERLPGINVLLYGPPGTGKTELTRALVAKLGLSLHTVPSTETHHGHGRFRIESYATAQQVLARRTDTVLIFDEIEDAFPYEHLPFFGVRQRSTPEKAWVHDLLETNPVPAIWITNHIAHLDPALLRRFALQVELRPLPSTVRARMVDRVAERLTLPESDRRRWASRMTSDEKMTPADLARVERAVTLAGLGEDAPGERLDRLTTLSLGPRANAAPKAPQASETYDPSLARTSVPLDPIVEGLRREGRGTVFLYGPPGTGKTAFAYHVARTLGRPIHHVRASDLLDAYLGETERKMAAMFTRARNEGAVLLLDEADSFFSSRQGAVRSWEVTQTNELLMQTEAADCIFLCTTNLLERIDEAAFRRFDVRVRFDPADSLALVRLIAAALAELGASADDLILDRLAPRLGTLTGVSAGDVKAARRQFALLGTAPTPEAFADALRADAALRGRRDDRGPRIGF